MALIAALSMLPSSETTCLPLSGEGSRSTKLSPASCQFYAVQNAICVGTAAKNGEEGPQGVQTAEDIAWNQMSKQNTLLSTV